MGINKLPLNGTVSVSGRIQGLRVRHSGKMVWRECTLQIFDGGADEKGGLSQTDRLELDNMDVTSANLGIQLTVIQAPLGLGEGVTDPNQEELPIGEDEKEEKKQRKPRKPKN